MKKENALLLAGTATFLAIIGVRLFKKIIFPSYRDSFDDGDCHRNYYPTSEEDQHGIEFFHFSNLI